MRYNSPVVLDERTLDKLQGLADNGMSLMRTYLPLTSHDDLRQFEVNLSDYSFRAQIVKELSLSGRKNFKKTITDICRQLMTDDLAHDFSWKGQRNNKMAMEDLLLKDLIFDVVRLKGFRPPCLGRYKIIEIIKEWLAQANNRLKRRQTKYLRFNPSSGSLGHHHLFRSLQN
nr:PREDICTED: uncharacterized protein LOC109041070 [Bemisia tabaci]